MTSLISTGRDGAPSKVSTVSNIATVKQGSSEWLARA